ncbi:hypothetical protein GALL_05220 [mine drainage metagenome]|uniref:Uncharacterized protein n=1 Tax=mine drainage metagenome TaxID=410659 RepID=A0A1J5TTP8_9ZZZZ
MLRTQNDNVIMELAIKMEFRNLALFTQPETSSFHTFASARHAAYSAGRNRLASNVANPLVMHIAIASRTPDG